MKVSCLVQTDGRVLLILDQEAANLLKTTLEQARYVLGLPASRDEALRGMQEELRQVLNDLSKRKEPVPLDPLDILR